MADPTEEELCRLGVSAIDVASYESSYGQKVRFGDDGICDVECRLIVRYRPKNAPWNGSAWPRLDRTWPAFSFESTLRLIRFR